MAHQQICEKCGASNPEGASFCQACDTYINWYPYGKPEDGADDEPLDDSPPLTDDPPSEPGPIGPPPPGPARAPVIAVDAGELTVTPAEPCAVTMSIKNPSRIVESYDVHLQDPPDWLVLTHGDTNLLPGEIRRVPVTLAVRPDAIALAQRLRTTLCVRSSVETTLVAEAPIEVVVPASGPTATLVARPNLLRLHDVGQGGFELHLDNRAANFPRRYRLAGSDPEGVVIFEFAPPVVDVPAGGASDAAVRFAAPPPPAGEECSRQLAVTATADGGHVTATVTLTQSTSSEPERVPVRLMVEPSRIAVVDSSSAMVDVVVDNRAGHHQAQVALSGRDPERLVSFVFDRPGCVVPPGLEARVRVLVSAAPPPRGESVTRSFEIVATEDGTDVTADGALELNSRPAAITSAVLRLVPEHLAVSGRRGTYAIEIDNRLGGEALHVHLSGADEYGRAALRFQPTEVVVAAGQFGGANLTVRHPRPAGGTSESRRIQVRATSGVDAIEGEAVFTQESPARRRLWAIVLVLVGAFFVAVGVLGFASEPAVASDVEPAVRTIVDEVGAGTVPAEDVIRKALGAAALLLVALGALMMLLGLNGTGRLVRGASIFALLAGVAVTIASVVLGGLPFVLVGAVLGFVGGVLLRSS